MSEQSLREQVAWASRILATEGYADLTLGHVSARTDDGRVYIKRKGVALDEVEPDDIVEFSVDDADSVFVPDMHLEAVLHQAVYQARPDVGAVVHGHPPYATALGATDASLELLTHDAVLFADGVPVFEGSPELILDASQGRAVAAALGPHRAVLLCNHGVLVTGKDVPWATLCAVTLERAAQLQSIASTFGTLRPIPAEAALAMHADKYRDAFVQEYWAAWLRKLGRLGADARMQRVNLELRVNGETVVRDVPAEELLLDFLRNRLDLTGAKRSCDVQVCGACTVLLDGQPVSACCTLAVQADGRDVTTIEGLAEQPEFVLLEDAFMRHAALQCGFCTGGMLLTVSSLLAAGDLTSAEAVRRSLAGNLCRCTGYKGIVEAVCELAGVPAA